MPYMQMRRRNIGWGRVDRKRLAVFIMFVGVNITFVPDASGLGLNLFVILLCVFNNFNRHRKKSCLLIFCNISEKTPNNRANLGFSRVFFVLELMLFQTVSRSVGRARRRRRCQHIVADRILQGIVVFFHEASDRRT